MSGEEGFQGKTGVGGGGGVDDDGTTLLVVVVGLGQHLHQLSGHLPFLMMMMMMMMIVG